MNEALKARVDSLIANRDNLVERLESAQAAIDERMGPALRRYFDVMRSVGKHLPCRPQDYAFDYMAVDRDGTRSYAFTHDCRDHGYDLAMGESVYLPEVVVTDPDAWEAEIRKVAEEAAVEAAAARKAALRRELEALGG